MEGGPSYVPVSLLILGCLGIWESFVAVLPWSFFLNSFLCFCIAVYSSYVQNLYVGPTDHKVRWL